MPLIVRFHKKFLHGLDHASEKAHPTVQNNLKITEAVDKTVKKSGPFSFF